MSHAFISPVFSRVETTSVAIILDEYRQAYREVHRVLTDGDPYDIVYLVARMDPSGTGV